MSMPDHFGEFQERCMIVGAGEGLGSALAEVFAANGCDLVLVGRAQQRCEAAREAALRVRPEAVVEVVVADASDPDELERIVVGAGRVDVLIYNVRGRATRCEPLKIAQRDLEGILRIEVGGALAAAKAVLPGMLARARGTLIYSSATAAFRGSPDYPLYSIGKFGLRSLAQSLAKSYGPRGIHVAHVRLDCALDTPLMRQLMPDAAAQGRLVSAKEVANAYCQIHRQPRVAWSNEVELRPYNEPWTI